MVIHRYLVALVVIGCVTACGSTVLVIESDTSWRGYVQGLNSGPVLGGGYRSGMNVTGYGDDRIELDSRTTCWNIILSGPGRLKVYAEKKSLLGSDRVGEDEVTVLEWGDEGHVEGCL